MKMAKIQIPARIEIAALAMFGFINLYMTRINLSVISADMIKTNETTGSGHISTQCSDDDNEYNYNIVSNESSSTFASEGNTIKETGEIEWDQYQKGVVLASFFYGYAVTQIIGGRLAELYGCKIVLLIAIAPCGLLTILSPVVARSSYGGFIALRIIMGLLQGPAFPAMHVLSTRWFPQLERSRFLATVSLSTCIGIIITMPMCGAIIDALSWDAAFYITGCLPLIWAVFWIIFVKDDPRDYSRITEAELSYIRTALHAGGTDVVKVENRTVPWKSILLSRHVWAIICCALGNSFGLSLFLSYLPSYLKNVLNFSMSESGILSGLPFFSRYIGAITASCISDFILSKGYISVLAGRRIFSVISMIGPAIMISILTIYSCNAVVVVICICVSMFMNGSITAGYFVNHTDLSPVYCGTLMGIENTFGSIISFINPLITGMILNNKNSVEQWKIVFLLCVPFYIICELLYLCMMSTTIQPWNFAYKDDYKVNKEEQEINQNKPLLDQEQNVRQPQVIKTKNQDPEKLPNDQKPNETPEDENPEKID